MSACHRETSDLSYAAPSGAGNAHDHTALLGGIQQTLDLPAPIAQTPTGRSAHTWVQSIHVITWASEPGVSVPFSKEGLEPPWRRARRKPVGQVLNFLIC